MSTDYTADRATDRSAIKLAQRPTFGATKCFAHSATKLDSNDATVHPAFSSAVDAANGPAKRTSFFAAVVATFLSAHWSAIQQSFLSADLSSVGAALHATHGKPERSADRAAVKPA